MVNSRRIFLRNGALALFGTTAIPAFLTRSVLSEVTRGSSALQKKLVVIFQRGAVDGLNVVVPYAESHYYAARPTISIPQSAVLDLDGFFGLHPALSPLKPLWDQKHLAVVHASGSPDTTRSHFDAQDFMESGTPGVKLTADGWLNRVLQSEDLSSQHPASPFRAVALGSQVPRTLQGRIPALAVGSLQDFSVGGRNPNPGISDGFQSMYASSVDAVLHGTGRETFEAVKMLQSANPSRYIPAREANYPKGEFGNSMRQIAQLLKGDFGVEAAFADIGGWDTHQNQGAANGQLSNRLKDLASGISAFWTDLGDRAEDVVLVTMSEFGRTVRQNGTAGTDHGHANVMFVLGGPVQGGQVYGKWPGLAPEHLYEGRDLAVTTDFRDVLGQVVLHHLQIPDLRTTFPGYQPAPASPMNLIRS